MIEIEPCTRETLAPLSPDPAGLFVGGAVLGELLKTTLAPLAGNVRWRSDFFPSGALLTQLADVPDFCIRTAEGEQLAVAGTGEKIFPADGILLRFPWDVLALNEYLVGALDHDSVKGEISPRAEIAGHVAVGEGTRILPGVYIEGNAVIGKNCKIGPNCYIRGNTAIGDGVHVGQAVEIKNSIVGAHSAVGHLSYLGDSILDERVNFGAGTIVGNLRHDGRNHRSTVGDQLIDTGRRKFGAIVGRGVHTGVHTAIYPGRKISAEKCTRPGEIVARDL